MIDYQWFVIEKEEAEVQLEYLEHEIFEAFGLVGKEYNISVEQAIELLKAHKTYLDDECTKEEKGGWGK